MNIDEMSIIYWRDDILDEQFMNQIDTETVLSKIVSHEFDARREFDVLECHKIAAAQQQQVDT